MCEATIMIDPSSLAQIAQEVRSCVALDQVILDEMRDEVRPLRPETKRIYPRSATAISLVGTDGGNNQLRFDPFMIQIVRVVDSSENELSLEAITQNTPLDILNARHLASDGQPKTALGEMMAFLEIKRLQDLSPVFRGLELSPSWVAVYREMTEWAVLFSLLRRKDFATDTVIVRDGFLRSKMFAEKLFGKLRDGMDAAIEDHYRKSRRRIYLVGIAKHSNVLQIYRLALALEAVMRNPYPCYLEVPPAMEERAYIWDEYFKRTDKFVAGKMYLVKFGNSPHDPVWAIDLLISQMESAPITLGYLLEDAKDGFPVPLYPQCLQRAHESAALVDFDMQILEDQIRDALRESLADKRTIVDELALQDRDPASRRYRAAPGLR
jgi:hypothetical protein